ncbi:MAG: lipoate--protein ligase family protein [Promethearchaeota archaeon]
MNYRFPRQTWRLIDDKTYPVQMGLSIDEMLWEYAENCTGDFTNIIRFYKFAPPCVVLGNHQDIDDLDMAYISKHKLQLGRRLTGGGAIIMGIPDENSQLGVSIICRQEGDFPVKLGSKFASLSRPILTALKLLGILAVYDSSSDILCHGRKITGQAIHTSEKTTFLHSTVTLDYSLETMLGAMGIKTNKKVLDLYREKFTTVRDEMMHIGPWDSGKMIEEIKRKLVLAFQLEFNAMIELQPLTEAEMTRAWVLYKEKHSTEQYINDLSGTGMGSCFL